MHASTIGQINKQYTLLNAVYLFNSRHVPADRHVRGYEHTNTKCPNHTFQNRKKKKSSTTSPHQLHNFSGTSRCKDLRNITPPNYYEYLTYHLFIYIYIYIYIYTRAVPKVMSNYFLHAKWEQQTKESAVVDGTSCCVILECLVTSIACIT